MTQVQADREPVLDDELGKRERMGRAAHVLLHDPHSAGILEVEPAAVEADALADDRDARVVGFAPFQLDQARGALGGGAAADRSDQRIASGEFLARCDGELRAGAPGEVGDGFLELGRAEVGRWRIDEVADERGGLGKAHRGVDPGRFAGDEDARPAFGIVLLRAVGVEAVLGEKPAERRLAGLPVRELVRAVG